MKRQAATVDPWNQPAIDVLKQAGKPLYWLVVSEDEAQALAEGAVCSRTRVAAKKLCESIGGLG